MTDRLSLLQSSVERLGAIVDGLDAEALRAPAYPTEWSVADVLSHLGSGAVIMRQRVDDGLAGRDSNAELPPSVWDEWNAKSPTAKAADALVADQAFVDFIGALDDAERARVSVSLGPMQFDLHGVLGLRLNEHVVHSWDIAVTFDPRATLPADATTAMIDDLGLVARFGGRPTGREHALHVRTAAPDRSLVVELGLDGVTMEPTTADHAPDLALPAEAFIRLVYGRLDAAHAPIPDSPALDELRRAYQGI